MIFYMKLGTVILTSTAILLMAGGTIPCAADNTRSKETMIVLRAMIDETGFTTTGEDTRFLLSECESYFTGQLSPLGKSFEFIQGPEVSIAGTFYSEDVSSYIIEACRLADKDVDFSIFDTDGDGTIDNVCVIFSGSQISPQQYSLKESGKSAVFDGKALNEYIALSEYYNGDLTGPCTLCHEYCHSLGLPDLYDTDAEGSSGLSEALWKVLSPMDTWNSGDIPAFSVLDYDCLGCLKADTLRRGEYVLDGSGAAFFLHPADAHGEYFLFEPRTISDGENRYSGLAVYHVDKSQNRSGFSTRYQITLTAFQRWERNQINCRPDHQCADLIEADPNAAGISSILFPIGERQTFCSDSEPAFRYWSGTASPIALHDIRCDESGTVSFTVIEPLECVSLETFQSEAEIAWEIDPVLLPGLEECTMRLDDSISFRLNVSQYGEAGITLTGLEPGHNYSYSIEAVSKGEHYSLAGHFSTKVIDERNPYPFIYLIGTDRNDDGSFKRGSTIPLRLFNTPDAESVRWHFNSTEISGTLKAMTDGDLRAVIQYTDGSEDIITKHITVR